MSVYATEPVIRADEVRITAVSRRTTSDRVFRAAVRGSGALTLALMALIGLFLTLRAWDALRVAGFGFFTRSAWQPELGQFGVWGALLGTVLIAVIALVIAVPVSICTALFVTEYAPARLRRPLTSFVDVLAAVPSLIYGLWGRYFLQPRAITFSRWLGTHLGFIPFFRVDNAQSTASYPASTFIAGIVVALMIVPICTAVMREVFSQAPPGEKEGALALGGTKWSVIKTVVLPFGKGGIIGGSMLGLGRALGETIAVTLIISPVFDPHSLTRVLQTGGNSIASLIALRFSESNSFGISALMAAGLTLFVVTLIVNAIAGVIVARIAIRRGDGDLMAVQTPTLRRETRTGEIVEERIRPQAFRSSDAFELGGAAFGSFCLAYLLYERLTPLSGGLGFLATWYALLLVSTWFMARNRLGAIEARDRLARVVVGTVGIGLLIPLAVIVGYTIARGYHTLRPQFFTQDLSRTGPLSPATEGGGSAAVIGSFEMVGIATLLTVPLGIGAAIFLNEIGGRLARPLRMIVDAMSAIPSIIAGLFIYAAFIISLHQQQTGLAAALALSVLMLPTVTRTAEVVLRLVPGGLREASLALGGGEWATVRRVVLPTARTGLLTAVILGIARIVGETAPLILTTLGNTSYNANPFKGKQDALPLMIYRLVRFPQTVAIERAWAGALALLGLVLVLFVIARVIGGRGPGHIGRLKRIRLARRGLA